METNQVWKIAKRLKTEEKAAFTAIRGKQGLVYCHQEKAQAIADVLEENFQPIPPRKDCQSSRWFREVREEVNQFLDFPPTAQVPITTASEVKRIVRNGKTTAPQDQTD